MLFHSLEIDPKLLIGIYIYWVLKLPQKGSTN
jgi:hypothetical protein